MWVILILLGIALILAGIFAKSLKKVVRTVLISLGGVSLLSGIVYLALTVLLVSGVD